jgi:hypothetical protein
VDISRSSAWMSFDAPPARGGHGAPPSGPNPLRAWRLANGECRLSRRETHVAHSPRRELLDRARRRSPRHWVDVDAVELRGVSKHLDVLSAFLLQPDGQRRLASGKAECRRPPPCDGGIVRAEFSQRLPRRPRPPRSVSRKKSTSSAQIFSTTQRGSFCAAARPMLGRRVSAAP